MERKYNVALEKAVMLEGEVATKTAMQEEVQRLKDELRGKGHKLKRYIFILERLETNILSVLDFYCTKMPTWS